ncbi:MAG: radical SAM protein [Thermoplasmatota archaeon]
MRITECFYSIQGEGRKAGLPTAFVRTTGCHLRCSWCDATYTFKGGEERSLDDLFAWLAEQPTKEVCFTGGEPLLQKEAWPFIERLVADGYGVVVETAGNLPFERANDLPAAERELLTISMDVKCPSSGEDAKNEPGNMAHLRPSDQLKFVIADRADYDYAVALLRQHGLPPCPTYFNPVGGVEPAHITEWLLAETEPLPVHVGVQLHKLVWGDEPGR